MSDVSIYYIFYKNICIVFIHNHVFLNLFLDFLAIFVRLHFIPESEGGSPELYKDIKFEKDKHYMERI